VESSQDEVWREVDDFDASGPEDNHYVLNRVKGEILFGNGINGRIPPRKRIETGEDKVIEHLMRISYRYGGGKRGNIRAKAAWRLLDTDISLEGHEKEKVRNLYAATGGKDQEILEKRKLRARRELKVRYRAVTSEDFESVAKATPGIRVARAGVQILPEENKVKVAVVPASFSNRPVPSGGFRRTVCEHLDKHRLITTQVEILEPHYVKVSVTASLKTKSQSSPEEVRKRVEEALNTFLHPLKGGPEGEGWPFGRDVYKSEVYEVIEKVDGVDGVVNLSISKGGEIEE
jgi:predicted phage baseplate assembly protein